MTLRNSLSTKLPPWLSCLARDEGTATMRLHYILFAEAGIYRFNGWPLIDALMNIPYTGMPILEFLHS